MRRVPVIPTIIVVVAVATMIALGIWQLDRRQEKAAALVTLADNIRRPPVAFPASGTGDTLLFRRSAIDCGSVRSLASQSGRSADARPGWRVIAACAAPGGATIPVQVGVALSPKALPGWAGGRVTGYLSHAPDQRPVIAALYDHRPKRLMLVADTPVAGLSANPGPDLSAVPNNHLAYAVQWFLFAGIAVVIYALALRRRGSPS